ncbi:CLUMA_CG019416, isoform A [Clunio marinus]|uniref:CLUMA_CG019416, isoform A n=1 Tax=Clunio marinus TaxID=568069 RepID=A0A1J1J1T5_9DIPT|nr:CLUMA_CG019416, isoform A [Clunio marinus]
MAIFFYIGSWIRSTFEILDRLTGSVIQKILGSPNATCGSSDADQLQQLQEPSASLLSPRSDLEVRLKEQEDIVERLTYDKSDVDAKLTTAKKNSKKMMNKLKEYQRPAN